MTEHVTVDDGMAHLLDALAAMRQTDVDLILCTGGMERQPGRQHPRRDPGQRRADRHLHARRCCLARCSYWAITPAGRP